MNKYALMLVMISLTGLVNAANYRAGRLAEKYDARYVGSFAQWTKNVGVTARHMEVKKGFYSVDCVDLEFFAHKGEPLQWASAPTLDTPVAAMGSAYNNRLEIDTVAVAGTLLAAKVLPVCGNGWYMLSHTAKTVDGMSGGPVFNSTTGMAIGITKGAITSGELKGLGVFIPFEVILAAWKKGLADGKIPVEFERE